MPAAAAPGGRAERELRTPRRGFGGGGVLVVRGGGCLEGDALVLELLDPGRGALLGLVVLVVLVAEEAAEHAVADGLGVGMIVPFYT